jgi:membrane protein DedA with SNARE-associated domain
VEQFLEDWGYLGIFLGIIATGLGFPMPEELPVVLGGVMVGAHPEIKWWIMLPVCIVGVIVGDGCLYMIGRIWGQRLLEFGWVKKRLLPPERRASIERNFHEYGIKILLFARLTPGIRAPIFISAGMMRLPLGRFLLADGIYAIPGVTLLFVLGYYFTDTMVELIEDFGAIKPYIILVAILGVIGYFTYRFLRRPMVTGHPKEVPPLVELVEHTLESTSKLILPKSLTGHTAVKPAKPPADGAVPNKAPVDGTGPKAELGIQSGEAGKQPRM